METKRTARLIEAMTEYDRGDAPRIQHFIKVHDLALTIGVLEGMSGKALQILETAAILHDIGIHPAEAKYGNCAGPHQEELGPGEAERLIAKVNESLDSKIGDDEIERVKFLIGHHHTYGHIDAPDWQILVEADFLVNLFEDGESKDTVTKVREQIFRTETGKRLLDNMFDI
jgi:uncharacterized protein